jgi:Spy/CpxP family protein refolding chaperone
MKSKNRFAALSASVCAALAIGLAGPAAAIAAPSGFAPPAFAQGSAGTAVIDRILATLESMKGELNLTPAQKLQFEYCVAQTRTLRTTAQGAAAVIKQTLDAELAKPQPDLALVAAVIDQQQAIMIAARHAARADWLQLYAMLSPDQQSVVGARLQKAWLRLEAVIEFLRGFAPAQP